ETKYFEEYNLSIETYYKKYFDILQFKNEIVQSTNTEDLFHVGDGRSYGLEVFLQKRIGQITGSIGYTLAWTHRIFSDLNKGEEYQPKYDRRNDITLAGNYQLDENWKFSAVFTYATGQAYTYGVGRYQVNLLGNPFDITLPGKLYNRRLSPYHRLDVSVTKHTTFLGLHGSWYFQIFNIYNRRNVWFKQFDTSKNPTEITDVKLLPIIPTFGFDFEF
ncbi:MAG: TonB-dependent receptor, partial [Bacteroidota bacterium]|nr:TonB-dependent receptor [Bacteroidota bacterium]